MGLLSSFISEIFSSGVILYSDAVFASGEIALAISYGITEKEKSWSFWLIFLYISSCIGDIGVSGWSDIGISGWVIREYRGLTTFET